MEKALHVRWIVTIGATIPSDGSLQDLLSSLIQVTSVSPCQNVGSSSGRSALCGLRAGGWHEFQLPLLPAVPK